MNMTREQFEEWCDKWDRHTAEATAMHEAHCGGYDIDACVNRHEQRAKARGNKAKARWYEYTSYARMCTRHEIERAEAKAGWDPNP